jgi:hypothetical protein
LELHILLSNLLLVQETYGDVLFAFSMHGTPKKIQSKKLPRKFLDWLPRSAVIRPFGMPCHIAVSLPLGDSFLTRCFLTRPSAWLCLCLRLRRRSKAKHERLRFNPEKLCFATWLFVVPWKIILQ